MTTSVSNATEATAPSGFAALNLSEPVLRAIEEVGYTEPTPVQAATYPIAITGRDIIVQARTGTGKTAAFGIPLVDKLVTSDPWVQALVLAPTRELAVQSQREIARLGQYKGLHTVAIYGGAPMGRQIDELKSGAQMVSGTPGRVLDHLRRGTFDPSRLKVLILDEMDEMLSMGFAKELNAILDMLPPRGRRQTMCFSATVDGEIRRHAERHMHEPEMISLSSDAVSAAQITHQVYMVSGRDRISDLVRVLEVEDPDSAIVFCNMRSETERVAMGLKQAGFNADWLNGDLPQKDRERIMSSTREGKLRYLVATDVAARGIDISHLTHVINFTFPESAAVYVHRTGRTGRAGRTGCAISLVGPEELGRLYYLRLEYKISPVERSMPTSGELKTRAEIDRIGLLEAAFTARANPTDLSIARRLLTHPENERILAGLLHTFFGTKDDVDDEAAAARRSKPGPDLETAARATQERERFAGGRPERRAREPERPRAREREREPRDRDREAAREREPRDADREAIRGREPGRIREDGPRDAARPREDAQAREPGRAPESREREPGRVREGSTRDRSERERPRNNSDERRAPRTREASAQREPAGADSLFSAVSDAAPDSVREPGRADTDREPGRARNSSTGERSQSRERTRARPARPTETGSSGADSSTAEPESESTAAADEASTAEGRKGGAAPAGRRRRSRSRDRGRERTGDASQPTAAGEPLEANGKADIEQSRRGEPAPRRQRTASAEAPQPAAVDGELLPSASNGAEEEEHVEHESTEPLEGLLYLNLGKRDGLRVPEVARLLRDSCELSRGQIGRIRVRDRYTFVDVPEGRLDSIITTLSGQVVHDKPLAPERAKTAKS